MMKMELEEFEKNILNEFAQTGEISIGLMELIGHISGNCIRDHLTALWDAKDRIRRAQNQYVYPQRYLSSYEWRNNGFDLVLDTWDSGWETEQEFITYQEFLESKEIQKIQEEARQAEEEANEQQRRKKAQDAAKKEVQERAEYERLRAKFETKGETK